MNTSQISRIGIYSPGVCVDAAADRTGADRRAWGLRAFVMMLLPPSMQARMRARREERLLAAQIARLEDLADHLLDDIAVGRDPDGTLMLETEREGRAPLSAGNAGRR